MKKIEKHNWFEAGLQGLEDAGDASIRIEFLCKKLGVTKGSFYHHFTSIDNYVEELLKYWEASNTHAIIETTEQEADLNAKPDLLNNLVLAKKQLPEVMIRSWAARNEQVRQSLENVDRLRTQYLQQLYAEHGLPEQQANDLARIEYAAFVGTQHLYRHLPAEDLKRLSHLFQHLIKSTLL